MWINNYGPNPFHPFKKALSSAQGDLRRPYLPVPLPSLLPHHRPTGQRPSLSQQPLSYLLSPLSCGLLCCFFVLLCCRLILHFPRLCLPLLGWAAAPSSGYSVLILELQQLQVYLPLLCQSVASFSSSFSGDGGLHVALPSHCPSPGASL